MADDFDVEAMLEAPYRKEDDVVKSDGRADKERRRRKSRSSSRSRSTSPPVKHRRKKSHSRERSRSRDHTDRRRNHFRKYSHPNKLVSGSEKISQSRQYAEYNKYNNPDRRSRREKSDRKRSRSREKKGGRDKERRRSRSPSPPPPRGGGGGHERYAGGGGGAATKRNRRSRSPQYKGRGARGGGGEKPYRRSMSKSPLRSYEFIREPGPELSPEERDARTIFCMQLSARIRPRDLEEFFSSVGKVRDVRLITDNKTRRSKGIAYVEFVDVECVNKALALTGQRLLGVPIMVQPSQAEKNRAANATATLQKGTSGPMRLYVGSLHFNITEEMLRGIFEPFGKIDDIKLIKDHESGRLQGYGFITFHDAEDAKKALEQLNGFELAGRPMKVGHVTERSADNQVASLLDSDEMDRAGIDLGATGRLQLMAKLAEGTGFQIPQYVANALNMNSSGDTATPPPTPAPNLSTQSTASPLVQASAAAAAAAALVNLTSTAPLGVTPGGIGGIGGIGGVGLNVAGGGVGILGAGGIPGVVGGIAGVGVVGAVGVVSGVGAPVAGSTTTGGQPTQTANGPPIPTQCFMLANMFDPSSESKVNWDQEIRDDVIEECNKHGGVVHIYVDKASALGNVYVKCPNIAAAVASVNALHGRYFAGKLITAAYVPLPNYHSLFPEAVRANQLLLPSTQALQYSYGTALYPGMPPNISR